MRVRACVVVMAALLLVISNALIAQAQTTATAPAAKEGILKAAEVGDKLFPDKVFFRGQSAPVQARNSAGVRFSGGFLVMAALVDNSGYSSGLREKYQGYLITEVPIDINGQTLKPGAYGVGFIDGNKFVVMDIGANDVFQVSSVNDKEIKRPVPLQIVAGSDAGKYRLYKGRDYVEFHQVK